MPNELSIPEDRVTILNLVKDVSELKRKARVFDEPEAASECCTTYCCFDGPGDDLSVGEFEDWCEIEPDPVGGEGLRLKISGWVRVSARSVGANFTSAHVIHTVNATTYLGTPAFGLTMNQADYITIPFGMTIDSATAAPIIRIRVQNIGVGDIRVDQIYTRVDTGPTYGTQVCGETGQ